MDKFGEIAFALGVKPVDLFDEDSSVIFAQVLGTIGADGGGMLEPGKRWGMPVPVRPERPGDDQFAAFMTRTGFLVGPNRRKPALSDAGKPFVVLIEDSNGRAWLERRQFENSSQGPGFQADGGDPAWRWIKRGDTRIKNSWRVFIDIIAHTDEPLYI